MGDRVDKGGCIPAPNIYRTPWSRRALAAHYDALVASLPFPVDSRTVDTPWGAAHVLGAGPAAAPPLILWQGTAAVAPVMLDLFSPFVGPYRVYAPDFPCQAGSRSAPAWLSPDGDIGRWAAAVVRGLDVAPTPQRPLLHAGISFGGGIIIDLARVDPALISAAALLVPSSLHPDADSLWSQLRLARRVFLPVAMYRWLPWIPGAKHRSFAGMFDEPDADHPSMTQQALAFKHVVYFPPPAKRATAEGLRGYTAPTLVVAATRDVFGGGEATAAAAAAVFSDVETEVVDASHVPAKEKMDAILARVARFFEAKGFGSGGGEGVCP